VALFTTVVFLVGVSLAGWGLDRAPYLSAVGWVFDQPVPFSHKHHVGDDGIDCRYCHTGVETSSDAGIPPTHTCMTCHSQLWTHAAMLAPVRRSMMFDAPIRWQRVSQLPDYVFFNHSIHISRGVGCVECHGRIDQMALTWRAKPFEMKFCLDCHRDPASRLRPQKWITRMEPLPWTDEQARRFGERQIARYHIDTARLVNCETCHR
jgi:hypothetical protein